MHFKLGHSYNFLDMLLEMLEKNFLANLTSLPISVRKHFLKMFSLCKVIAEISFLTKHAF